MKEVVGELSKMYVASSAAPPKLAIDIAPELMVDDQKVLYKHMVFDPRDLGLLNAEEERVQGLSRNDLLNSGDYDDLFSEEVKGSEFNSKIRDEYQNIGLVKCSNTDFAQKSKYAQKTSMNVIKEMYQDKEEGNKDEKSMDDHQAMQVDLLIEKPKEKKEMVITEKQKILETRQSEIVLVQLLKKLVDNPVRCYKILK
jgi:hypothetical protein